MSEASLALFGLIGAAIGAIPGILSVVIPWLRNRDKVTQAMRDLELATKEVEFISSWLEAASGLSEGEELTALKRDARERLNALMSANRSSAEAAIASQKAEARERPKRKGRAALLVYLGFFCFMVLGASIDNNDEISLSYFVNELSGEGGIILAVFAVPLIFLSWRWYRSNRAVG